MTVFASRRPRKARAAESLTGVAAYTQEVPFSGAATCHCFGAWLDIEHICHQTDFDQDHAGFWKKPQGHAQQHTLYFKTHFSRMWTVCTC